MVRTKTSLLLLVIAGGLLGTGIRAEDTGGPIYRNPDAALEDRVNDLLGRLTLEEKKTLLRGPTFSTQPIPRLGLPAINMADAGQGVRGGDPKGGTIGPATLFGAGVMLASTWDIDLAKRVGEAIGDEARNKGDGAQVLLGPAINIHRSPLSGRDGEYLSEDPYLASRMAVNYILGMQSTGVSACAKHFACNNEEADRDSVSVEVSERALREIYLPAFEAAVKEGHVWSVMAAYNKVRGKYMTANPYLLKNVLRTGWGFDGEVISDWGAVHEPAAIRAGTDVDMCWTTPGGTQPAMLNAALASQQIDAKDIDDAVRCTLRLMIRTGGLDPAKPRHPAEVNSVAHQELAYEVATKGIVLLKNTDHVLPLDPDRVHSLALIGPGMEGAQLGAEGSPHVDTLHAVMPREGITQRAGNQMTVRFAPTGLGAVMVPTSALTTRNAAGTTVPGVRAEYFDNTELQGQPKVAEVEPKIDFDWTRAQPNGPVPGIPPFNFSVRWTGKLQVPASGQYSLTFIADDGCRVFLDNKAMIDHWVPDPGTPQTIQVALKAGRSYDLRCEYFQEGGKAFARFAWQVPQKYHDAVEAAKMSDVAIICVTTRPTETEGADRPNMTLPQDQDSLIQAVAAVNKHTVVILNNGGAVGMAKWIDHVPGLIECWFPGQAGGTAIAALLFGDVNPSGKLPDTLAVRREDYPDFGNFPGTKGVVHYAEGIYVGYRHFDQANIKPLFPFGFGLSYTTFAYSNLHLSAPELSPTGTVDALVDVTNKGRRAGDAVVELYVHDPHPQIDKAPRELKAFSRVSLAPGETKTVTLTLSPRALAYCDVPGRQWRADAGSYEIEAGDSSRNLPLKTMLKLDTTFAEPIAGLMAERRAVEPGH